MSSSGIQQTALSVTRAVGSPASIVIHTILFAGSFGLAIFGIVPFERMLLILTTLVSLEAIYLAIFIQMTINYQGTQIAEVTEDIDEIQEDVGEIQEDVEEMTEDVEEIQKDVDEIQKDVDELQEDVEDVTEGVDELEESESEDEKRKEEQRAMLTGIESTLRKLAEDIERLKGR
jgi:uncharacterized protein YoxC